ncbi:MAG: glycosyltransferase family 2 protein [Candidatus Micrarchaeia archaeon]
MYKKLKIAVVVPAYNCGELIQKTLLTLPKFVDYIIAVDDASTDSTPSKIRACAPRLGKRLVYVRLQKNRGVGGAIVAGYKKAVDLHADAAVVMAGDAQMNPVDLPALLEPIAKGEADYVKGNRLKHHAVKNAMPQLRYFGNSLLTILTKFSSGYWNIQDPQCGYTAITREALEGIELDELYPRYGFPNDLLAMLNAHNYRVTDVKVEPVYGKEKSGIRLHSYAPKLSWLLTKRFFWRIKKKYFTEDFHPVFLFFFFGFLLFLAGTLGGAFLAWQSLAAGVSYSVGWMVIDALALTTGLQLLLFAFWQDSLQNK